MSTGIAITSSSAVLRLITAAALFVSEPHPSMFGNGANESPSINKAWTNHNWLKSRFHFSFAEYGNPANDQFGVLRVANDDLVQPARGFGTHPHANMEICTYIVDGELTHQDSTTNVPQTVTRGGVQFMSAGSGVRHSEHNRRSDRDLRFIQLWILPRKRRGQSPRYGQYVPASVDERLNQFVHLVGDASNAASGAPISVDQDVNIYAAEIDHGRSAALTIAPGRQAYCLFLEGARTRASLSSALGDEATMVGELPSVVGNAHDGLEVVVRPDCDAGPQRLTFANEVEDAAASEGSDISRRRSHVLVIEMAYDPRAHGRRDLS